MYKVKCTGKNLNYGKLNEVRLVADNFVSVGVKRNWFEIISYEGSGEPNSLFELKRTEKSILNQIEILNLKLKHTKDKIKELR